MDIGKVAILKIDPVKTAPKKRGVEENASVEHHGTDSCILQIETLNGLAPKGEIFQEIVSRQYRQTATGIPPFGDFVEIQCYHHF